MAITTGALLGAAGIGAVGSLLSGILGSSSQSSANRTNIELQRETNAQNYKMFQEQLAWQEDMWNKTNQYNSPAQTVKRLQAAGINPALGSDFGQASTPSVPSASPAQAARVSPVDYSWMGNIVDQGVNAYLNNNILNNTIDKSKADAQIAKVEAEFSAKTLQDRCIKVLNDSKSSEYQKEQARLTMEILESTKQDQILSAQWSRKIQEQNYDEAVNRIAESKLRQDAMRIANEYAPRLSEANLKSYQASCAAAYAAARASDAQALDLAADKALKDLQSEGQVISNDQARDIKKHIIDKAKYEANLAKENVYAAEDARFARPVDFYQRHLGKAANYTITPGSSTATAEMMDRNNRRDRFGSQHNERFRPKRNY